VCVGLHLQLGEAQLNIAELNEISEKTRSDLIEAQEDLAAAREYMDALLISNSDSRSLHRRHFGKLQFTFWQCHYEARMYSEDYYSLA